MAILDMYGGKSAGDNSKETVRTALEDDAENACLEGFSVHAECGFSCCGMLTENFRIVC